MATILPFGLQQTLPGTAFHPSKIKIVSFYLANKILARQSETEAAFIPDCDLYGDQEPWEIFQTYERLRPRPASDDDDDGDDDVVRDIYCFTKLKKKSKNRIDRTVGKGTWHAEGKPDNYRVKVNGNCNIPACCKRYSYKSEEDSDQQQQKQHGRWSLLEYSCSTLSSDIVMCILRKNDGRGGGPVPVDAPAPTPTPTPTLKRKAVDCPIAATEEGKRMRFVEAEYIVESPTNYDHYSEISHAASTSGVEEWSTVGTTIISRSYSSSEDGCSGSSVSDCAIATGEEERMGFEAVESPTNYEHSSEISPAASASGVEEWSVDTAVVSPSYKTEDIGFGFGFGLDFDFDFDFGSSDLSDWVDGYNFQVD